MPIKVDKPPPHGILSSDRLAGAEPPGANGDMQRSFLSVRTDRPRLPALRLLDAVALVSLTTLASSCMDGTAVKSYVNLVSDRQYAAPAGSIRDTYLVFRSMGGL